jgi:hypothetical protein
MIQQCDQPTSHSSSKFESFWHGTVEAESGIYHQVDKRADKVGERVGVNQSTLV